MKLKAIFSTVGLLVALSASAQTLLITNGVQTYASLTSTAVTMSNRCELRVTDTNNPIPGCTINLTSSNAWFFLTGIKPSVVVSTYLSQVLVNGAAAVSGSNVRVVEYGVGAVVIPHAPGFQPLQVFTGTNFTGSSSSLSQYTAYTDANLGAFNNSISSFHLKRGYMATFAQNADGSGISHNFIAADGDLDVSFMPAGLDETVSFIRIFPWRWATKKGFGQTGTTVTAGQNLNLAWNYSWDINQNSTIDREYVAIRQQPYWPSLSQDWQARGINTVLGLNEPDNPVQDAYKNLTPPGSVSDAVARQPDLLATGLRIGSPAVTDGGRSSWLYPFMQQADAANSRVDFVAIHYYWCYNPADPAGAATQMYNFLLDVYNNTHRPIWITEWNNGANWTGCGDPTYAQQQAAVSAIVDMLENTPFVERYAVYNWVEDVRRVAWDDGSLTLAGETYRDKVSRIGYLQDGIPGAVRSVARFQFEGDVLDSSGAGNNGIAVGVPSYGPGTNGLALQLDGTNSYVILPASTANSSAFTFAAWVNWDGGANWQRVFDFGNDTSHYLFLSPNSGSGLRFAINNGGGEQTLSSATALPVGQWQHVAVTISNSTARLYTNGVLAASSTSFSILPSQFNPQRNYLGKSQFSADPLFRGRLDEVVLAHYAMSPAEIAALSANQAPVFQNIGNNVWTSDGSGNWSDNSRWSSYLPANGAGYTADFSFLDITANRTATLDSSRNIGTLKFGDVAGAQNWILAASGGSVLTLDSGSATQPSIVVDENTATISAPLAGTNGLAKTGVGTLVLSGANPLSGVLNIDAGSSSANNGVVGLASPGAGTNLTSIAIRNNNSGVSTLQLSGGAVASAPVSLSGRTTNVAAIENLSGSNSLTGGFTINSGGSYYLLQSDAGTLNLGGIISAGSSATGTRNFTFRGAGDHFISGSIQNGSATTVNLMKQDAGTLTLAGANTFTGAMNVGGGAVKLNSPLTIQNTPVYLTCAGTNTLKFGPITGAAIGSLSGIGDVWLTNASFAAVMLTNAGSASTEYAGSLKGTGGLVKSGSGTLTLSASNAYTGATTVSAGTLRLNSATNNFMAALQPVLWMSFDQAGNGVVTNQGTGGWAMNGTLIGSGAYITNAGRFGSALYVNGSGGTAATNIVQIASKVADTSASGSWTVGYWVKTTTAGAMILYQGDGGWSSSGQTTYLLNANSGGTAGTKAGAVRWGGGFLTGTAALNDGNWHFIALVDTVGTETIYVDGNVDAVSSTMSGVLAAGADETWIGGAPDADAGAVKMTGMIDEVCLFNRALTVAEIRGLYTNAPTTGKLPAASVVNVASGATLDLNGTSQTVAMLGDDIGGGMVTNRGAAPVTLTLGGTGAAKTFSGVIADTTAANALSLVKNGAATETLSGINTYRGTTTVNSGGLLVNGRLGTNSVTLAGGTLGGSGVIPGALLVSGGTLAPGTSAVGILTCSNNVTLQGGGTTAMELDKLSGTNDQLRVSGTLNYGGVLSVTSLSGSLAGGDTFKLFSAGSSTGYFSSLTGSPGAGLDWKFNPTNGVLTVYSTVPVNLAGVIAGNTLQISWPADHLGWTLQAQTNDLNAGLGTNWFPIDGSTTNTQFLAPLDAGNPAVFYRLIYQ